MKNLIILAGLIYSSFCAGSGSQFPVKDIPDSLMRNVDAVLREDHMLYTIDFRNHAIWHVHQVVTILNENGTRYASEVIGYDKLSKVTMFKGSSYDANGNVIKRLKTSEIYDQSSFDGFSLYSDNRLKAAQLSYGTYPYTVEFEYEIEFKYLFMIPGFVVVPGERVSVQNSSYQLAYQPYLRPKYKLLNIESEPKLAVNEKGFETLTWSFKNIKPLRFDPLGPPIQELIPQIIAAPSFFDFEGYQGSSLSWDDFGQWIISLNRKRNILPDEAVQKIQELAAKFPNREDKVKAVYEYMQSRTRYVSIQLGIGGFQPFEASLVDKVGYGDCKALSNYMVSMLESIGINSNYVLIKAGNGASSLREDFPSSQFNHAVVMVPNEKDTLWLECTSQTNPFGYMGTFTGNRKALAVTKSGAQIVRTPSYKADVNVQSRKASVTIEENGNATATVKTKYSGLKYESEGLQFILEDQYDEQKKWVEKTTDIPSFNINSFKMENQKGKIPTALVNLDLRLDRYASVNGKRMFLTPNLMTKMTYVPPKVDKRKTDVVIRTGFYHTDTIQYAIPDNIYPEALPETKKYTSIFGDYQAQYVLEQGKLVYIRSFKFKEGTYPAASYNELIEFSKNISKADNTKVVFLNKT